MKKIISSIICFLSFIAMVSCHDEKIEESESSSFNYYTSASGGDFNTSEKRININDYVGFYDLSTNYLTHEWRIPNSGKFLNNKFTNKDSIFDAFIISQTDTVSNSDLINVLFTESGLHQINLKNTYKDSVKDAVKIEDVWQVEKSFTVDVYASINTAYKVLQGETEVLNILEDQTPTDNEDEWPEIILELGSKLTFVNNTSSIGRWTSVRWEVNTGESELTKGGNDNQQIIFNKLGEFSGGQVTVSRGGGDLPKANSIKIIPLKFKVVPSSLPFVFNGGVKNIGGDKISFKISGEAQSVTGSKENFNVHVINTSKGVDKIIDVIDINTSTDDLKILELTLSEPIYIDDQVTVEYESAGNIIATDLRVLESFPPKDLVFSGENVLDKDVYGFETDSWFLQNANQWEYSADQSAPGGSRSLRFFTNGLTTGTAKIQGIPGGNVTPLDVPAGDYLLEIKVWIDPDTDISRFDTNFVSPWKPLFWDLSDVTKGEWVTLSKEVSLSTYTSGVSKIVINVNIGNHVTSTSGTFYLDDFSLSEIIKRP